MILSLTPVAIVKAGTPSGVVSLERQTQSEANVNVVLYTVGLIIVSIVWALP